MSLGGFFGGVLDTVKGIAGSFSSNPLFGQVLSTAVGLPPDTINAIAGAVAGTQIDPSAFAMKVNVAQGMGLDNILNVINVLNQRGSTPVTQPVSTVVTSSTSNTGQGSSDGNFFTMFFEALANFFKKILGLKP